MSEESVEIDKDRIAQLEEEGDIAADYLEELLDICDLGGDLEIDVENDRASVEIIAEGDEARDLERLVGKDGKVLESLQELARMAVSQKTGERSRLMLDIAGYRADRKAELTLITEEAIAKTKTSEAPVKLVAMNPFERKVCHDVAAEQGFYSCSEGQAPNRAVVIYPEGIQSQEDLKADVELVEDDVEDVLEITEVVED